MDKRLIDIKELSQFIGISRSTIYTWISQNRIPYIKFGHSVRFDLKVIEDWIVKNSVKEVNFEKDFYDC